MLFSLIFESMPAAYNLYESSSDQFTDHLKLSDEDATLEPESAVVESEMYLRHTCI